MFSPESKIFLWIKPNKRKAFFVESLDQCRRLEVREKARKCFLWWAYICLTTRCYTTLHPHQVFFLFRSDFLAFFAHISYFKILEFKEFDKTITPFALVGYLPSHIQSWLMILLLIILYIHSKAHDALLAHTWQPKIILQGCTVWFSSGKLV